MPTTTGVATTFIDFTRASNATVTDSDGKVKWAPANLLTNSESFDAASWTKVGGATVEANSVAAPNGTTTADRLKEATATDAFYTYQIITAASNTITFSVFAKTAQRSAIYIRLYSAINNWEAAVFDLNAGTNPQNASGSATTFTNRTQAITPIGGGWNLCSITATLPSGAISCLIHTSNIPSGITFDAYGDYAYAGNSANGVYLWGASLYRSDLGGMQPNTSAYPLYNPTTPKNLLGYTESLTTGWTNSNTTDAIVSEVNPVGLTGAVDVAATAGNGTLLSSLSLLASPYTFSVWLKRKTGSGTVEITVDGTTYVAAAVTGTWTRFSTTLTPTAGTKTPGIRLVTSGDAVYAWGAQLSDSASLDSYVPVYGAAVTSAAYYGPRRDFDGSTLACKGLLVEEQRTNLVRYSRTLETTGSYWGGLASGTANTITIDNAAGPDGLSTSASMITYNTAVTGAGTYSAWRHTLTTTANGTYTFTIWLKAGTTSSVYLRFSDSGGNRANTLCTLTSSWQRFTVTGTTAASITTISCDVGADGNAGGQTLTAGTVYAYGAQLEAGSFATSYVPNGSTVNGTTRNADIASVRTQAFPYSATESTLVVSGVFSANSRYAGLYTTASADQIEIVQTSTDANSFVFASSSAQANIYQTLAPLSSAKIGLAAKLNDFAMSTNGSAVTTDTSGIMPTAATILYFNVYGASGGSSVTGAGHIRQITYLPRRISNAELVTRTT